MQILYLSRRNLQTLLNKLNRTGWGTLHKRDTKHPKYPSSDTIMIHAVEDQEYYTDREPGSVNPLDDPDNVVGTND